MKKRPEPEKAIKRCRTDFNSPMAKRIRFAFLNQLLKSYARIIPRSFTFIGRPFSTMGDVARISEEIIVSIRKLTESQLNKIFWEDMMDLSNLPNLHRECYEDSCSNCEQMPVCSDFNEWRKNIRNKAIQNRATENESDEWIRIFNECIQDIKNREPETYHAALLRKINKYKKDGQIITTPRSRIQTTKLNSCEDVNRFAQLLARFGNRIKITETNPKKCFQEKFYELSMAFYDGKKRCFMKRSDMRKANLKKLLTVFERTGMIVDWDKFGFNEHSSFETIDDVYKMAEAAYRARKEPQYTYDDIFEYFSHAFFNTNGKLTVEEKIDSELIECYFSVQIGNFQLHILRNEERETIVDYSHLDAMRKFLPEVRSFSDVRKIAEIACFGRIETDAPPMLSLATIKYDLTEASRLKELMTTCFREFCRNGDLPVISTIDVWKTEMKDCYKREIGTPMEQESIADFDKCVKESPLAIRVRITNLKFLLESYENLGVIASVHDWNPLPSSLDGVKVMSINMYHLQVKNRFQSDMMTVSGLPKLYRLYFSQVCVNEDNQNCLNLAKCSAAIKTCEQKTGERAGELQANFDGLIEEAVTRRIHSTYQPALKAKLEEYERKILIGKDLSNLYKTVLNSDTDVEHLANRLYQKYCEKNGITC